MPSLRDVQSFVDEIIKSPTAQRFLERVVTDGFYNRSRVALWMFETIGREWDSVAEFIKALANERFPPTATWSIPIWEFIYEIEPDESLSLEQRRARIMARVLDIPPINPAHVEFMVTAVTGFPAAVTENIAPYTFRVNVDGSGDSLFDNGVMLVVTSDCFACASTDSTMIGTYPETVSCWKQ